MNSKIDFLSLAYFISSSSIFTKTTTLEYIDHLIRQFHETGICEWLAFSFGVIQVILAWRNVYWNFYAGIVSVILYTYVFYQYGLYAESSLNVYYLLVSIWGLVVWKKKEGLVITRCSARDWERASMIVILAFLLLYFMLKYKTYSTVPVWDALVSSLAWSGSWLLSYRKLENWLVLNTSNILALPLLMYKSLPLTALLTLIYIVVAIMGYLEWRRHLQRT